MSSHIRIQKTCQFCGDPFTAKTTVTQFCSDDCAKRAYKERKRKEKIGLAVHQEAERSFDPTVAQKEFLSIEETCRLINASRWTVYRLIEKGVLPATKLGRITRIARSSIDNLFKLSGA
jgi:excisionase family DNA binding protein